MNGLGGFRAVLSLLRHCPEPLANEAGDPYEAEQLTCARQEVLEDICAAMSPSQRTSQTSPEDLIERALRNLERDLQSYRSNEVMEDVKREIAYRRWCEIDSATL